MKNTENNRIDECLVSVIIPVYNVSRYVRQCIDSVICQSYSNLEIIIIDDGSSDNSGTICEEYAVNDDRISVYHTGNQGLSAARNYGIDRATGQYIIFIDSDDWMEHHTIQTLLSAAKMSNADIIVCGHWLEWVNHKQISAKVEKPIVLSEDEILQSYLSEPFIGVIAWNKLYRIEMFDTIRFPVGRVFEDIATTYRLLDHAKSVCIIPDALIHYRIREQSLSHYHTMDSLIDYWHAHKERYDALDWRSKDFHIWLVKGCLRAISRMWRWYATFTRDEKRIASVTIESMQRFARIHYNEVMSSSEYSMLEKSACVFAKYKNNGLFMMLNAANKTYRRIDHRRRHRFK